MTNATQSGDALPDTDYFELDSAAVGTRFAVWVTRPLSYAAQPDHRFPLLYVTDGNPGAALIGPYTSLFGADQITPIEPYVQVSVGYPGMTLVEANIVRNRDLLPPDEPVPAHLTSALEAAVADDAMTQAQADEMMATLREPHADRFLEFIETELHPLLTERYRVQEDKCALFGYSYGGLFSLYVLLKRSRLFDRIGAGSPGITGTDSRIFTMLEELASHDADFPDVRLCLTMNELELIGPAPLYRSLSQTLLAFVDRLHQHNFTGLKTSARILAQESHISGWTASFHTFIRTCFRAGQPGKP